MEDVKNWLGFSLEKPGKKDGDSTDKFPINTYTRSHLVTTIHFLKRSKDRLKL
jgi:hypothetical protein